VDPVVRRCLDILRAAALDADAKALDACRRSKYSIQDYWMCLEFWTQRLHDDIARDIGLDERCPHGEFRKRLAEFKRSVSDASNAQHHAEAKRTTA
jgi:hypothetical protein